MKINSTLFKIIKSTSIILLVSSLTGLAFVLLNKAFWPAFLLTTCVQYVLFSAIAGTINSYFAHQTRQKELDKLEGLSTILECATCKTQNITTFIPDQNERFEFLCEGCQNKNVVNINFTVARVTEFKEPIISSMPKI